MLKINAINYSVNENRILKSVSCQLAKGRITMFIGESGAGKTSLLKSVVRLIQPTSGNITLDDKDISVFSVSEQSENIGFVFQNFNLFQNLDVLNNCIDPLIIKGIALEEAKKRALKNLKKLGLENYESRSVNELSQGQQQRVAIARSLCLQPLVLLFDEPTASLDPNNTDILVEILKELAKEGLMIGVSSQDMSFVRKIIDKAYFLSGGKIVEILDNYSQIDACPNIKKFIKLGIES